MVVFVNGEEREVQQGLTVEGLLAQLNVPGEGVAVALNGQVVVRGDRGRALQPGDRVELIRAVGGG
jgi:sulfur carrier protein